MKIYAPVKDTNGVYASVRFVNGVGETDNPRLIEWFSKHGYMIDNVEKCYDMSQISYEKCDNDPIEADDDEIELMGYTEKEPDFDAMTPNELREWAKANGFGSKIKSIRSKEKLIEILRG